MSSIYEYDIEVWFGDLDSFGHVNNARIFTYLEAGRFKYFKERLGSLGGVEFVLARVEVDFIAPINLGDIVKVKMWVGEIGNSSWEFLYSVEKDGKEVVKAKSVQVWYDLRKNKSKPIPERIREVLEEDSLD
ncbi:MAG: acyl-CoA thioesterase [Archaeoglobus sp.]|nr:acyl-CoA thioesterase [Archaeoglobus sp.]